MTWSFRMSVACRVDEVSVFDDYVVIGKKILVRCGRPSWSPCLE